MSRRYREYKAGKPRGHTLRHRAIKLTEIKDKGKISEATREKEK